MNVKLEMLKKLKKQKPINTPEKINSKKKEATRWFVHLRDEICKSFEIIENTPSKDNNISFSRKNGKETVVVVVLFLS